MRRGLLLPLLFSCFLRGLTLTGKGDYDEALASFTEGLSLAERVGDEAIHHRLLNCLGWLYADLGDLDRRRGSPRSAHGSVAAVADPGTQPERGAQSRRDLARPGILRARRISTTSVFRYWQGSGSSLWMRFRYSIRMFAGMGELALARGDLSAARSHSAECLELATRTGSRKNLVKGWRLAGEIARAERDWDKARRAVPQVARLRHVDWESGSAVEIGARSRPGS